MSVPLPDRITLPTTLGNLLSTGVITRHNGKSNSFNLWRLEASGKRKVGGGDFEFICRLAQQEGFLERGILPPKPLEETRCM